MKGLHAPHNWETHFEYEKTVHGTSALLVKAVHFFPVVARFFMPDSSF